MKSSRIITLIILSGFLVSESCKKHVVKPVDQLSLLPPATQTGANTFGCLVNGQAFVPNNQSILQGPAIQCNYIYTAGGYNLNVAVSNKVNSGLIKSVIVGTDSLAISEGQTLIFKTFTPGNAEASFNIVTNMGITQYITTNKVSGQLTITKFDQVNQIVSGIFSFNAINTPGDTVKVTNGRFDMLYTR